MRPPSRPVLVAEPWRRGGVFPAGASGRAAPGAERWERRAPWKRTEAGRAATAAVLAAGGC